jgi:hypothetical protein
MNASEAKTGQKRIEDLTLKEVDMIYSLARVGEWTDVEIGRRYCISQADVRRVVDNYEELRGAVQKNQHHERLPQEPSLELTTKERKRRNDARFVTAAGRQAAYRARLKENRRASLEQPSPANETDSPGPDVEELPAAFCQDPVTETSPVNADPKYSTCDSSSVEGRDISESVPLPVTVEACSEREELRVIEE